MTHYFALTSPQLQQLQMTSEIQILSTPDQLVQADELCSPLGWGITLADWEMYQRFFLVFGILDNNRVIATSVLYPQGSLVTIGAVIVHPEFRRRGLAHKLVSYAMAYAKKDPKVTRLGLLGSGMGSPIYSSLGFQTVGLSRSWEGQVDPTAIRKQIEQMDMVQEAEGSRIVCPVVSADDWEKAYQISSRAFYQADRQVILETAGFGPSSESINSVNSIPLNCLVVSRDGRPQAFGVVRPFPLPSLSSTEETLLEAKLKINMLVAHSSYLARLTVAHLLKALPQGTKIKVEVQLENDGEEEAEWKKNQRKTSTEGCLRSMLNDWGWKDKDGNKIMVYRCEEVKSDEHVASRKEQRWELDDLRQFCPFDAL